METTIALGQVDARDWLDQLGSSLAQRPGYEVSNQADELVVSRSYISDNRLVGSIVLGLFTAGIGLLLLTRRDTEAFTVSVMEGSAPDTHAARVSGEWSADTESLIAQQGQIESSEALMVGDSHGGRSAGEEAASATDPAATPAPVVDVAVAVAEEETPEQDVTRRVPAPREAPPSFVLQLDDGQRWTLAAVNIVGRGPSAPPGSDDQVQLIQIEDPTQSVSKNHARILIEDLGIRVVDMQSTNGTSVVLPGDQRVAVDSEVGVLVPLGASVEIGERAFTFSSAGVSPSD